MTIVAVITAKRNGFRRCGVAHSDKPTVWQENDFTQEQWKALAKEPQLILTVEERDLEPVWEPHHELTSAAAIPETSFAPQIAQPQASETGIAPVGDAVDAITGQILDGADAAGANGGDQVGPIGPVTGSSDIPSTPGGDAMDAINGQIQGGADAVGTNGGDQVGTVGPVTASSNATAAPAATSAEAPVVADVPAKPVKSKQDKHKDVSK
jgi:Mu-like prophage FluMu N-terminal domain